MRHIRRKVGCGLWLVWMVLALFGAEWLLLWVVINQVPRDYLPVAVLSIAMVTIAGASAVVYLRVQRRMQ
jgi:hypothetical protein